MLVQDLLERAAAAAAIAGEFLSNEVFGRARPEAQLRRMRANAQRGEARQRRHAGQEKQRRARVRAQRAKRNAERWARIWHPIDERARAAWKWAWE